jgi:hypothetical protein
MRTFCAHEWRLIAVLVLSIVWIAVFPMWSRWVSTDPLNIAISLSPPEAIEENIHVKLAESYSLHLMFARNGIPFERLRSTIGAMGLCKIGEQCPKGIPVAVRWSLKSIETGEVASRGEVESIDSSGWSDAHVYRNLGTVKVQPGRYAFRAEVLRPVPDLANMRTHIAIQLKPKRTTTWQMGLVWWGAVGQYLLAWPLVACAGVLLLWRAGLTLRSSGAPVATVIETFAAPGGAGPKRFFSWIQFIYGLGAVAALVVSFYFQLPPAAWVIFLCMVIFGMVGIHLLLIKSRGKRLDRPA